MGLFFQLDVDMDMGFPIETEELGLPVDYGPALDEFIEIFLQEAYQLVPVDTGFLLGSIAADHDGECIITCEATADYAQYVEFGTWKMMAQPYFIPALEAAWQGSLPYFRQIWNEAQEEEREMLAEMQQQEGEAGEELSFGGGGGLPSLSNLLGGIFAIAAMAVAIFAIDTFFETLNGEDNRRSSRNSIGGSALMADFVEIL